MMITGDEVRNTWIKIPGKEPMAVFLNGECFINPKHIDIIKNILDSWYLNKVMKK